MSKSDMVARISDLSAQLGRELPKTGSLEALQSVIDGAETELALLNGGDLSEGAGIAPKIISPASTSLSSGGDVYGDGEASEYRLVKLRSTLDIVHYVNHKAVRDIIPAGREIYVSTEDAPDLIAANLVYAL